MFISSSTIRYVALGVAIALALYFAMIPVRLSVVRSRVPEPQVFLVLGGSSDRIRLAAQLTHQHPQLDVWVSSGQSAEVIKEIFAEENVSFSKARLDYRATDTVTNFTTMSDTFQEEGISHVYLVTSDYHMKRARAIAFLTFGSRAIAYEPIQVSSDGQIESHWRTGRDITRSVLWLTTGKTGSALGASFQQRSEASS